MTLYFEGEPQLVMRPTYGQWEMPAQVADFSKEERPAFRVECNCRNCGWKAEARFPVGAKIPLWLRCPKCEVMELSAHGGFLGRDELTREQEQENYRAAEAKRREMREKYGAIL